MSFLDDVNIERKFIIKSNDKYYTIDSTNNQLKEISGQLTNSFIAINGFDISEIRKITRLISDDFSIISNQKFTMNVVETKTRSQSVTPKNDSVEEALSNEYKLVLEDNKIKITPNFNSGKMIVTYLV